jgi:2'-5' RNA ligase
MGVQSFFSRSFVLSSRSIHLTLKFLGEVDPVIVPKLAESLQSEATVLPHLSLRLHGLRCFPNLRNSRVI